MAKRGKREEIIAKVNEVQVGQAESIGKAATSIGVRETIFMVDPLI